MIDSLGIGEMPDAAQFGDSGADTLGHIVENVDVDLPNLRAIGLGNIRDLPGLDKVATPTGAYGKLAELSQGKDTATGHWEFCGLVTEEGFKTFPDGFPPAIMDEFIERSGVEGILGNTVASGTEIIVRLGKKHEETGWPIIYTSADPVFQIAAHESVIPVERLYELCKIAYDIVIPIGMGRVIARPYVGEYPNYERTYNRHDYSYPPPEPTLLDDLVEQGVEVTGIGKISDIFAGRGVSRSLPSRGNEHGMDLTIEVTASDQTGFIFTNLVDFDSKYGHRRDPVGYGRCLENFDKRLPALLDVMRDDDILILSADHGNDPTYHGTDHTREYVPLLVFGKGIRPINLGTRATFADVGQTLAEFFGIEKLKVGESFLDEITMR